MSVTYLEISYPNFVLGAIIDPAEANQNNHEMVTKINSVISTVNINESNVANLTNVKADKVYVDSQDANLSGTGRTNQTIKGNYDALITHKSSGDHDGRYYTKALLDNGQLDNRYYTETEVNTKITTINNRDALQDQALNTHRNSTDHDYRYYTKEELSSWLRGGDTTIKEEVFNIVTPDNGDGTFTYSIGEGVFVGYLTEEGFQTFSLNKGFYEEGLNRVEGIVNDTLRRSVASGGLIEVDNYHVAVSPEGSGAEITIRYYERLGMAAEYNIKLATTKPPQNNGKNMWFEVIG